MALTVKKVPFRRWPVTVTFHVCDEAGNVTSVDQRFIGRFKPLKEEAVKELREKVFGTGTDDELAKRAELRPQDEQARLEAQYTAGIVCGWEAVTDESGAALPFTDDALIELLTGEDGPAMRRGFGRAVFELRLGVAPAKNAVTSPEPGPVPTPGEAATS